MMLAFNRLIIPEIRISLVFILFLLCIKPIKGQYFTDVAVASGIDFITDNALWGCGISFYDFDHDGWDDISLARQGFPPRFFKNTGGTFQEFSIPITNTHEMKMIQWVDFDNDGDSDLFITRRLGAWQLFKNNGDLTFTDISQSAGLWTMPYSTGWPTSTTTNNTYGASWGDYDKDGDLDLYICNYHHINPTWTNVLFRNNGNETFTELAVAAGVDNGITTTFQSIFLDADRNNKQDLYLANDRIFHENKLYSNNENGTFTDVSAGSGANVTVCSMSATLGDYNNDGLSDIYVTNGPAGNKLLRNQGNYFFTEQASASGTAVLANCWGASWLDYNLDGWLDLYVPTGNPQGQPVQDYFYSNNQNGTFSYGFLSGFQGVNNESYSAAIGDFDNDGFPDIGVSRKTPFKMGLHRNNLTDGNHIKITVEGTISNKDGIGTWIDVYAGGIVQSHYTRCGEGFLAQNSQHHIFGLGTATAVDSVVISWLSGIVETYYDLSANQSFHFVEGMSVGVNLGVEGNELDLCAGESIILDAGVHSGYLWSTGETTQTITVQEPGSYFVQVTNIFGIQLTSETVTVNDVSLPPYTVSVSNPLCFGDPGGQVNIDTQMWENMEASIDGIPMPLPTADLTPGVHQLLVSNGNCEQMTTLAVEVPDEITATFLTIDVACFGENNGQIVSIEAQGGTGSLTWEMEPAGDPQALTAGNYTLIVTDQNNCTKSIDFNISEPDPLTVELTTIEVVPNNQQGSLLSTVTGGTSPYDYLWSTGANTPNLELQDAGTYSLTVTDANGCEASAIGTITVGLAEEDKNCRPFFSHGSVVIPCADVVSVRLYAITGQLLMQQDRPEFGFRLNLPAGQVTLLQIVFANGSISTFKAVEIN